MLYARICFFFGFQKVPPGGNTTFEVVFLARQVGNVENTLYIHTSKDSFKYQVSITLLIKLIFDYNDAECYRSCILWVMHG